MRRRGLSSVRIDRVRVNRLAKRGLDFFEAEALLLLDELCSVSGLLFRSLWSSDASSLPRRLLDESSKSGEELLARPIVAGRSRMLPWLLGGISAELSEVLTLCEDLEARRFAKKDREASRACL